MERAPSGANWVHEVKFDGYRLQLRVEDGKARLLTRNLTIYGLGGVIIPFIGIKLIDVLITTLKLV